MVLDLLIRNARVVTVDPVRPRASTLGIWNGRIVGLDEQVDGLGAHAEVDLGGAVVTPGFHDAHCHTTSFGLELVSLALQNCSGVEATLAAVADHAEALGPRSGSSASASGTAWVSGRGRAAGTWTVPAAAARCG
jgi:predicted amidohydrolase YtcJ